MQMQYRVYYYSQYEICVYLHESLFLLHERSNHMRLKIKKSVEP